MKEATFVSGCASKRTSIMTNLKISRQQIAVPEISEASHNDNSVQ
jgi:hypothetical protein